MSDSGNVPKSPKYEIDAPNSQFGIVGDQAHVEGGIHFHSHTTPAGKPLQRPPRAEHFTDREQELAHLLAQLQPGQVATLCGPGGIGKSALAAEAVWQLAPATEPPARFPDGIIFHSFYNQPQAALALEQIAHTFGEEPRPTPRDGALRALAGKQALLLLDGTEAADDLATVLEVRGGCGVLVTSRQRKDAPDHQQRQDVPPLPLAEAVTLLGKWGGAQQQEAVAAICRRVGRLPLAVRLVGRYLAETGESAAGYLTWLEETPLEALNQGQRQKESVPLLLERSLAQVSDESQQVLAVVGQLALAPFGGEPLAAALDVAATSLRRPLGELVSYGLLLRTGERYEVSHALIHTYVREQRPPAAEVIERLADYYNQWARGESGKGLEGYRRLTRERPHLLRVLAVSVEQGQWPAVEQLAWALSSYLFVQGNYIELINASQVGLTAAQKLKHRQDEESFLSWQGLAYSNLGQVARAIEYYEQALAISREIGHRQGEGAHLGNLGTAYSALGQVERAIDYYEQALAIDREIGYRQGEGSHLGYLGLAYSNLGQVARAIEYYEQALAISREIGHRQGEGTHLGNLGNAYSALGQVEQAIEYHQQALTIAREIGHRQGEGRHLGNLGLAYRALGNRKEALKLLQEATNILKEIGHPDAFIYEGQLRVVRNPVLFWLGRMVDVILKPLLHKTGLVRKMQQLLKDQARQQATQHAPNKRNK